MDLFSLLAVVITATALISYVNERFVRLPPTIGVMSASLAVSLVLAILGRVGAIPQGWIVAAVGSIDFSDLLLHGLLSFLLFAGALHVELENLLERKWSILSLATVGVALSTFLIGTATYALFDLVGIEMPYAYALVFGALISPTDPIAVLGILRGAGAPKNLESMIIGESLFNDGVGVVVFLMLLGIATGGGDVGFGSAVELLAIEALGGLLLGLALGYTAYLMLRSVDHHIVEIMITLAIVTGGYALADALHTSGPITMVVAGLFVGNHGRRFGMSDSSRQHLDDFWEVVDELLNAVLFVLIGFEVLLLDFEPAYFLVGILAIPLSLAVRFVCVAVPISILGTFRSFVRGTIPLMTWGGIRGGISIALALSLPPSPQRDVLLFATYAVVLFSILVQGLSLGRVVRRLTP